MASSNVCFNEGVNCTCSSPPPVLPPRPDFCTQTTTTAEPTTTPTPTPTAETTESTTTGTEVNTASPSGSTTYDGDTTPMDTAATSLVTDVTIVSDATAFSTTTNTSNGSTTAVPNTTSHSPNDTSTPLITSNGTTAVMTTACSPNDTTCSIPKPTPAAPPVGLIVGCTCGAIIFIVILGVGIWWFWKKGKLCFRSQDDAGKTGSQECLPGGEEKQVELVNIKKGTVILNPLSKPPQLPPLEDDPPPKPPINNTAPGLTPVEGPKEEAGVSPSQTTEGRPESATSKKSRRGSRSNKVSPTPEPETK